MNTEPWIARSEREPTKSDYPVETWNEGYSLPVRVSDPTHSYTHWRRYRFTPPVTETLAQLQEKRDREWAGEFYGQARRRWSSWPDELLAARRLGREDCRDVVEQVANAKYTFTEVAAARDLCSRFGWGGAK